MKGRMKSQTKRNYAKRARRLLLRRLTAGLREVSLQPISNMVVPNIVLAETYAFHEPYFAKTPELYHAAIHRNLQQGSRVTTAAYIQSRRELDAARAGGAVFSNVDPHNSDAPITFPLLSMRGPGSRRKSFQEER